MRRVLPRVFGEPTSPRETVRRTVRIAESNSRSSTCRPRSSPMRKPVVAPSSTIVLAGSDSAPIRALSCSGDNRLVGRTRCIGGSSTPRDGFASTQPHCCATLNIFSSVLRMWPRVWREYFICCFAATSRWICSRPTARSIRCPRDGSMCLLNMSV